MTQHSENQQDRESGAGREKQQTGTFLGAPYDWRRPAVRRFKERNWNRRDNRLVVPKDYGWGWTVNLYELLRRLHLRR